MPERLLTGQVQHAVQEHDQLLLDAALQALEDFAAQLGPIGLPVTEQPTVVFLAWETARCGEAPGNVSLDVWSCAVAEIGTVAVEAAVEAAAYANGTRTNRGPSTSSNKRGPPALSEWGCLCDRVDTCARAAANVGLDQHRCDELRHLGMLLLEPARHFLSRHATREGEASETNSCSEGHSDGYQSGSTASVFRASADSQTPGVRMPANVQVPSAPVPSVPVSQRNESRADVSSHTKTSLPFATAQSSKETRGSNKIKDGSKDSVGSQLLLRDPKLNRTLGLHTAGEVMKLLSEQKLSPDTVVYGLGVGTGALSTANDGLNLLEHIHLVGALDREDRRHKVRTSHERTGSHARC